MGPMDINLIIEHLKTNEITITLKSYHEIVNGQLPSKDIPIIYSFSQRPEIRAYLKDMATFLHTEGYQLVPSLEILLCHENKGYQELVKNKYHIDDLNAYYFAEIEEIKQYDLKYPVVLKRLDGSNGKGVFLVEDEVSLIKKVNSLTPLYTSSQKADLMRRKYFRKEKSYKEYPNYNNKNDLEQYRKHIKEHKRFVIQEFISGLDHDYRVLVAGDRYYITKRHTKDDFKASGTKLFDFDIAEPEAILAFAKEVHEKIDSPFLSLDICRKGDEFYLIEFQGLHFGMNVVVKGSGYYKYEGNGFTFTTQKPSPEETIAYGLANHLNK